MSIREGGLLRHGQTRLVAEDAEESAATAVASRLLQQLTEENMNMREPTTMAAQQNNLRPGPFESSSPMLVDEVDVVGLAENEDPEGAPLKAEPCSNRTAEWAVPAPTAATAAKVAKLRELMQQQMSMRPDHLGYHPVRYDHPYVRQLGMPIGMKQQPKIVNNMGGGKWLSFRASVAATAAAAVQRPQVVKNMWRCTAPAVPNGGRLAPVPAPAATAATAATAAAPLVQQPKTSMLVADLQRKVEEAKKNNSIETLGAILGAPQQRIAQVPRIRNRRVVRETSPIRISGEDYAPRTEEEELKIRGNFMAGMDGEDEAFLKLVLDDMHKNGATPFGRKIEFVSRLRAYTPMELKTHARLGKLDLFYDDPDLAGIVPHPAGCARAQGFYRLTFKQKIRIMRRPEALPDTEINERIQKMAADKEQRSMNRRLQMMMDSNPNSEYFKVNQLKYRKKMIKFARSHIHGWGLFAMEPIAPDDMVVEYIGEKVRPLVAEDREKHYERKGIGSSYLFRIDDDEVIDATRQGNFARFINHCCQPNCYAKVMTVDGEKRIVIYSKTLIQKGDEITYDYKFPLEEDKIECLCGAPGCRGSLN